MNDKVKIALAGVLVVILFVLANSLYVVSQTEQAIVLQFGEPMRVVKEPGLKIKVPFIQNVVFYDNRLLNLDPPAQEVVLNDKNVWTSTVLPVTALLSLFVFTKLFEPKPRRAASWKKS